MFIKPNQRHDSIRIPLEEIKANIKKVKSEQSKQSLSVSRIHGSHSSQDISSNVLKTQRNFKPNIVSCVSSDNLMIIAKRYADSNISLIEEDKNPAPVSQLYTTRTKIKKYQRRVNNFSLDLSKQSSYRDLNLINQDLKTIKSSFSSRRIKVLN